MHMADALISPAVGGTMWVTTATLVGYCAKKVKAELDDRKIPLMGVLGAFIFAAQMINFTIPATGSSGHLTGGLLLAILLGPQAAFLVMASVLTIQALFFADGGLLALGCNVFNMGFCSCFIGYLLIYKKIVRAEPTRGRLFLGSSLAAIIGLQCGAFSVVLETLCSGITTLPFTKFVLLMQPIHLAIGLVEGIVTATVILFIWQARPELLERPATVRSSGQLSLKPVLVGFAVAAILVGGVASWFASVRPDGLEWATFHTTGKEELQAPENGVHSTLSKIQEKTAFLPDYSFKKSETQPQENSATWPAVDSGTSLSGLIGGAAVLILAVLIGFVLKKNRQTVA
jgi:cobalt/nickel transport system permease protein